MLPSFLLSSPLLSFLFSSSPLPFALTCSSPPLSPVFLFLSSLLSSLSLLLASPHHHSSLLFPFLSFTNALLSLVSSLPLLSVLFHLLLSPPFHCSSFPVPLVSIHPFPAFPLISNFISNLLICPSFPVLSSLPRFNPFLLSSQCMYSGVLTLSDKTKVSEKNNLTA